jgi:hypothetical protein
MLLGDSFCQLQQLKPFSVGKNLPFAIMVCGLKEKPHP